MADASSNPENSFEPRLTSRQVAELFRLLGEIDEFKGYWRKLRELRAERLAELRQVTTIESAGSSTRIEGAELSDAEVAQVLDGLSMDSFRARDEAEVRGYGELLQLEMREDPTGFGDWLIYFLRALHVQQQNLAAKLEVERSMQQLSATQTAILEEIDRLGRVTSTVLAERLDLPPRTVRYHLQTLIRQGLVEPQGEKRGRTYRRGSGESPAQPIHGPDAPTAAILAAILEAGGTIRAGNLNRLVKKHGYDPCVVGTLHGKRLAHLRRKRGTGESVLTARGREVAEQYLFARRLARVDQGVG